MVFLKKLHFTQVIKLDEIIRTETKSKVIKRATAIKAFNNGVELEDISKTVGLSTRTLKVLINRFSTEKFDALYDAARTGRPKILNDDAEFLALTYLIETPKSLKTVAAKVSEDLKINFSIKTLKRMLNAIGFTWKRVRKSLALKRNEKEFREAMEMIKMYLSRAKKKSLI